MRETAPTDGSDAVDDESRPYGDPATRRRILEATRVALDREGADVSLSAVARRAGVSRQALYLHFGGRQGLLLGVVRWMDEQLELERSLDHVMAAPTPSELLLRLAELNAVFWGRVAPVASVLQSAQELDDELAAAWRDRMAARRNVFETVVARLDADGVLAADWDVEHAADMVYAVTHFDPWRELTQHLGWDSASYAEWMSLVLQRSLLVRVD